MRELIWRKSVYKNDFKCTRCNRVLMGADGKITKDVGVRADNLFCRCGYHVAYWGDEMPECKTESHYADIWSESITRVKDECKAKDILIKSLEKKVEESDLFYLRRVNKQNDTIDLKNREITRLNKEILRLEHELKRMEEGFGYDRT